MDPAGFQLVELTARREADLKYSIFNRQSSIKGVKANLDKETEGIARLHVKSATILVKEVMDAFMKHYMDLLHKVQYNLRISPPNVNIISGFQFKASTLLSSVVSEDAQMLIEERQKFFTDRRD